MINETLQRTRRLAIRAATTAAIFLVCSVRNAPAADIDMRAADIDIHMEGSSGFITGNGTLTRTLVGIPPGVPGSIRLKLKWHVVASTISGSFTFNQLSVQLRHGSNVVKAVNCYSVHSNKLPQCDLHVAVSADEANTHGEWSLIFVNTSSHDVTGLDVEKGKDTSPAVPDFTSTYTVVCPQTVQLTLESMRSPLRQGETRLLRLYGIGKAPGLVKLKAKWHAVSKAPTYNYLNIELLAPNGQSMVQVVPDWKIYASMHAVGKYPKLDVEGTIFTQYTNLPGDWKLKITNNSDHDVTGFNVQKESGEMDKAVPAFSSSYQAHCNFQ